MDQDNNPLPGQMLMSLRDEMLERWLWLVPPGVALLQVDWELRHKALRARKSGADLTDISKVACVGIERIEAMLRAARRDIKDKNAPPVDLYMRQSPREALEASRRRIAEVLRFAEASKDSS